MQLEIEQEVVDSVSFALGVGTGLARLHAKEPETVELMTRVSDSWLRALAEAKR